MNQKGFTLIEILIAIAILVLLTYVIIGAFFSFNRNQALDKDVSKVTLALEEARQFTLFSKESSQYGIHFDPTEVILFKGSTYSSGDPENVSTKLNSLINISTINLLGGGNEVIFERLTGETNQSGTITLEDNNTPPKIKTITIEGTGLIK
jgi:prepilin-type N-terminal cleavage/methylation domain-containing protein